MTKNKRNKGELENLNFSVFKLLLRLFIPIIFI